MNPAIYLCPANKVENGHFTNDWHDLFEKNVFSALRKLTISGQKIYSYSFPKLVFNWP